MQIPKTNAFNFIRLVCCLMVIFYHCTVLAKLSGPFTNIFDGHLSVCVFFLLSGLFVTKSYINKREQGESFLQFYARRAKRILPAYYTSILFGALIFFFFTECTIKEYFLASNFWKYLFWNGIFLNFMQVSPVPAGNAISNMAVNGALWTIKIEVAFYLILPILVLTLEKLKQKGKQNLFMICIYIFSVFWYWGFDYLATKTDRNLFRQLSWQIPGFMSYFVSGMFLVYNYDFLKANEKFTVIPAIIFLALHFITGTEFLMPAALAVICLFVGTRFTFFSEVCNPVDWTYGMYLFHFPVIQIFVYLGYFSKAPVFAGLLIVAISFALSYLEYKLVERKINRIAISNTKFETKE